MTDPLELPPAETIQAEPEQPSLALHIKPWMILTVALVAIAGLAAVSAWTLVHDPSEGERAAVLETWKSVGLAAFFYFLGSSAGSRNKDQM